MKRLSILLLLLPLITSAQSIKNVTTDKFTGVKVTRTTEETLRSVMGKRSMWMEGSIQEDKGTKIYYFTFWFVSSAVTSFRDQDQAIFKLTSGETLKKNYTGSYQLTASHQPAFFTIQLTPDDLKKLHDDLPTDLRLETSNYNADVELKKGKQDVIPGIAKLLLEEK